MQENQQAVVSAYKKTKAKSQKILDLGIRADMTKEEIAEIVLKLSEAKGMEANKPLDEFIKGQEWYVKDLMKLSALNITERFVYEVNLAVVETSSKDELMEDLEATFG